MRCACALVFLLGFAVTVSAAGPVMVKFESEDAKNNVPERYRLAPHEFPVTVEANLTLPITGIQVDKVTFPSAITSKHPENNTVYAEYFHPVKPGRYPAVIVLDILDGKQIVSRGQAVWLAQHDICALVVTMAYYGPRRPVGSNIRMISPDIDHSLNAIQQTILDNRRAIAWLAKQPDVDAAKVGVVGTSLGSFMATITAASEPTISHVCLLLPGGGLVDSLYDHPKAKTFVQVNELLGGSKEKLKTLLAPVDPLTFADRLKNKRVLILAASRDDVVPPAACDRLWEAAGKPRRVNFDATHVGAAAFAFPAMKEVVAHIVGDRPTLK